MDERIQYPVPNAPPAVELAANVAWREGARVYLDGHCICCREAPASVSTIEATPIGKGYEPQVGDDDALVAMLRDAGFAKSETIAGRWFWRRTEVSRG